MSTLRAHGSGLFDMENILPYLILVHSGLFRFCIYSINTKC